MYACVYYIDCQKGGYADVLSSSDGELTPSIETKLKPPSLTASDAKAARRPPSPKPSDAGIPLRCDRDFTDGEAMVQEHLMSSESELSPSEAVELSPHLEQHRSMEDIPWWSSSEFRKVCVGGNTEHIYVRRDQFVRCGYKGEEWLNCPGELPSRWHKHTSSEQCALKGETD